MTAGRAPTVPLTLKTAIGTYPHTVPLKNGSITSARVCFDHVEVVPANRAFRPMVNQLTYDVSEMALVTLMLGKAFGRRLTGVPVILMQQSAYGMLMVRPESPLTDPRQLAPTALQARSNASTSACRPSRSTSDAVSVSINASPGPSTVSSAVTSPRATCT